MHRRHVYTWVQESVRSKAPGFAPPPLRPPRRWFSALSKAAALLAFLGASAVAADEPHAVDLCVRSLLFLTSRFSDMKISAERVKGSIKNGRLHLTGVKLHRENHPASNFDLNIDTLAVSLSDRSSLIQTLFSPGFSPFIFESVHISGLRGIFEKIKDAESKNIAIDDLKVKNANIEFLDSMKRHGTMLQKQSTVSWPIVSIDSLHMKNVALKRIKADLRAILKDSVGSGAVDGQNWAINPHLSGSLNDDPSNSQFRSFYFNKLPLAVASRYLVYPFSLIENTALSVKISEPSESDIERQSILSSLGALAAASYLGQRADTKFELHFTTVVKRNDFTPERIGKLAAEALVKQAGRAVINTVSPHIAKMKEKLFS